MNNYEKIIQAATKLMSEKGYHGTTLQMVADEVGVSKAAVVHHFKSKEGLISAIVEKYLPSASKEIIEITKDEKLSGIEKLKKYLKLHIRHVDEHRDVINLYFRELRYFGEENRNPKNV